VTIVGMAGVGKTALAVHWAHEVRDQFPDGQLYLNLRGFDPTTQKLSAADGVRAFLDALDVVGQRIPVELDAQVGLYRTVLAERRVLILLDNAHEADQVRPLIPAASGCLVLVTSRTHMPGLVATEGARQVSMGLPTPTECRQIFVRRIGQRRATAEPGATATIVDRCAQLPLALAVAAAHAATRPDAPLSVLAADLAGRPTLTWLDTADRGSDVRSVFSWSYHALTPAAARLFRLLGLHQGPDLSLAAAASLAGTSLVDATRLLDELAKAHLVEEHVAQRFQLHDLLREFATSLTEEEDPAAGRQEALRRLLDHYLHSAVSATLCLDPHRHAITLDPPAEGSSPHSFADETEALAWFGIEQRPLVSATAFAANAGFERHCWSLAWALATHLVRRGQWHDWISTQQLAVDAAGRTGSAGDQAVAHRGLGAVYAVMGRYDEAHASYQRALDLFAAADDNVGLAHTYHNYTWVFDRQERYADALYHIEQALRLDRLAGLRSGEARALNGVGHFLCKLGDLRTAVSHLEQAVALCQELGDPSGEATAVDDLGEAYHRLAEPARAIECYERAIELLRAMDNRPGQAETLDRLGDALSDAGRSEEARAVWSLAADLLTELERPQADKVRAKAQRLPGSAEA
jgi:tetratricopeptide (TPR) repeat protein